MLHHQKDRSMLLLIIVLASTLMSQHHVEASHRDVFRSDRSQAKLLRQLLRELQSSNTEASSTTSAVESEGECSGDLMQGYRWDGTRSISLYGIDSAQRCLDHCDINEKCTGWSYDKVAKTCTGYYDIVSVVKAENTTSGSCSINGIKGQCNNIESKGYYGWTADIYLNISSKEACLKLCQNLDTCFVWQWAKWVDKCYVFASVGQSYDSTYWSSGYCYVPQKRHRTADPIKIFRSEILDQHNMKRKEHCVSPLTLDTALNTVAQDLANSMVSADVVPPVYKSDYMVNVYYHQADPALRGSLIIDNLYSENQYYNWQNPDWSLTNHFPKIVWKSSTKLGAGRAFAADNITMYVTVVYDWKGDMTATYKENVPQRCV